MGATLETCKEVGGSDTRFTWLDGESFLLEQENRPLDGAAPLAATRTPASTPPTSPEPSMPGSRSGRSTRPIRGTLDEAETTDGAGLDAEREAAADRRMEGSVASGGGRLSLRAPRTVRFRDLDSMGHVNNAVYLTYLEEARIAFLRPPGADVADMILARVEIDFRAPVDGRRGRDRRAARAPRHEELRARVRAACR